MCVFPRTSLRKVEITQEQAWDWMWPAIGSIGSMKVTLLNLGFMVAGHLSQVHYHTGEHRLKLRVLVLYVGYLQFAC